MLHRTEVAIAALFLLLSFASCNRNKTVSMKAAVVYKIGGAQPVARVPFYLLKDSLENILRNAGLKAEVFTNDVVREYAFHKANATKGKDFLEKAEAAIMANAVKKVTTDFDGTAKFEDVPPGTYYLMGVTETRGVLGYAIWNYKIEVGDKDDTVILDQNNAHYSS
jgi:hypothetical protein